MCQRRVLYLCKLWKEFLIGTNNCESRKRVCYLRVNWEGFHENFTSEWVN